MPDFTPPQDYSSAFANVPPPGQSFMQGVQGGLAMQQAQLQQATQRYQFARMQQMQQAAGQVAQNPTPENISQLSIAFPEMSEQFKRSYDMLQPQQQRNRLNTALQVHAAALSDRPEIAANLLNTQADAMENSGGNPQEVASTRALAQWATAHPDSFKVASGIFAAGLTGPEKYGETFNSQANAEKTVATTPAATAEAGAKASEAITTAQNAQAKQTSDIAKTQADTANLAGRLALDKDKLTSETQVKMRELQLQYGTPAPEAAKLINDSAMGAASGEQSAARLNDLADRMEQVDKTTGNAGSAVEAWKRISGSGDGVSAAKQEYARIVNNQALGAIKESLGGRVTDVDMKAAMSTVPSPNDSIQTQTSYLRGVAKIQMVAAAQQQAQAEWLAQVGRNAHLGPAPHDITVMGTKVPQGTSFADFSREFVLKKAEQITAQSAINKAQGRSYLRFAEPQQPQQPQQGGATGSY